MSRVHVFGLLCAWSLVAAGCGDAPAALEERQAAATLPPGVDPTAPIDFCAGHATRAPDAYMVMGPNVTEKELQLSAPPLLSPPPLSNACPARVVDVLILSTSSPDPADCTPNGCYAAVEIGAGAGFFSGSTKDDDSDYFYLPTTSSSCTGYAHFVRLYRKLAGESAFALQWQFNYRGQWDNGLCTISDQTPPPGLAPYFPNDLAAPQKPTSGADIYRVVAGIQVAHTYVPLRFKAGYEERP